MADIPRKKNNTGTISYSATQIMNTNGFAIVGIAMD